MFGSIKRLKRNVRTTWRLAYHGWKNLTHASKTRQVKRTQMFATVRFMIRVFVTFSDSWESIKRNETVALKDVGLKPEPSPESCQQGALHLRRGTWYSENLTNSLLIYSVSCINLKSLSPMLPCGDGMMLNFAYAALMETLTKNYRIIIPSSKA